MTGSLPSSPPSVGATAKNRPHLSQIPVSQNLDSASSLTPRFRAILGIRSDPSRAREQAVLRQNRISRSQYWWWGAYCAAFFSAVAGTAAVAGLTAGLGFQNAGSASMVSWEG